MSSIPKGSASIIPTIRFRDAPKAIEWLCEAFGFEKHLIVPGDEGHIAHAQLIYGNGMIMCGSSREDDLGKLSGTPAELGGKNTQSAYIIVPDADAHHARAVAAGARVVFPLKDPEHGGRGYSCLDLEGNLWHFGTYDPWREDSHA